MGFHGINPPFFCVCPKKKHIVMAPNPLPPSPPGLRWRLGFFEEGTHPSMSLAFFCCCDDHGRYFKPNMAGFSSYNWGNLEFINELLNAVSYFLKQHQFAWSRSTRTISHIHNSIRCQLYRHEYHEFGWWKAHQIIEINIIPVWIHCL